MLVATAETERPRISFIRYEGNLGGGSGSEGSKWLVDLVVQVEE